MASKDVLQREFKAMRIEALIAQRENLSQEPLPVPTKELLARYERLYTGAVNDVLREHCLLDQALPKEIKPLCDEVTVAGLAFTAKSVPKCTITGHSANLIALLDAVHEDAFIVWDTTGDEEATLWGGVMTATAMRRKVKAAAIDGGIRDTRQILEAKLPVYYRFRTSNGATGRAYVTDYQIAVRIGKVLVRPGDIIVADIDGVVCVPRALAYAVLQRAEELIGGEKQIFDWVGQGKSAGEITDKGGYF